MTTIRMARFADIPQIVRLAQEAADFSRYSGSVIPEMAKSVALECIAQQADKPGHGAIFVADDDRSIIGLFIGVVRPFHECMDFYMATNLLWYVTPGTKGDVGWNLLEAFKEWAGKADGRVLFRIGLSDTIMNEKMATASVALRKRGYSEIGRVFEKEI